MYDFGARQFDMQLGRWTGVDPLSEKYFGISTYAFVANNPVKYFDPNGKEIWIHFGDNMSVRYDNGKLYNKDGSEYKDKANGFLKQSVNSLNLINSSNTGNEMLTKLTNSTNKFNIKHVSLNPKKSISFVAENEKKAYAEFYQSSPLYANKNIDWSGSSGGTIYWNPAREYLGTTKGLMYSPATDLAHELAHGYDADRGLLNRTKINGLKKDEYQASYRENLIRNELGMPYRKYYGALNEYLQQIDVPVLDSNVEPILPLNYEP